MHHERQERFAGHHTHYRRKHYRSLTHSFTLVAPTNKQQAVEIDIYIDNKLAHEL